VAQGLWLRTDHVLHDLPNVFLTPHIAGSMGTELLRMGEHMVVELERYVAGEPFAYPKRLHQTQDSCEQDAL
jgi:phosphoglycerate dehydrogenase-like enzyme